MAASTSANLSLTVAHAVSFLTRPLVDSLSGSAIIKLQMILEANLIPYYAPTWDVSEPLSGSGRRCLTLSPSTLPPRPIYATCNAVNISWNHWITSLGGFEFDFFVDPGCVSLRLTGVSGSESKLVTIWADELLSPALATPNPRYPAQFPTTHRKTFSQQLSEVDAEEDEQLFSLIANQVRAPTWLAPPVDKFSVVTRSTSPLSSVSPTSRCSSRSSTSSSGFSYDTSSSASSRSGEYKQSRRERARQSRVFIDTTKTEVTPYDGGKTTVLTGGVMLGGGSAKKVTKPQQQAPSATCNSWRSVRV